MTRWSRSFSRWWQDHPIRGALAIVAMLFAGFITFGKDVEWIAGKLWPPIPRILEIEEERGARGNFAVTIENPTDMTMIVNEAVFRAEPPPAERFAHFNELQIPAVTYEMPFDCSPGTKRIKLRPPFRVTAKNVGAVVFRSTVPMRECQLFIALKTSQGQTKEQEAVSLTAWRNRAP